MNIFYLDHDTDKSAEYHVDKHVVKMPLETAQLLCGVHHSVKNDLSIPYKKTHVNHPSSVWARRSRDNYNYLVKLGISLCEEYKFRYGKEHGCKSVIYWCKDNIPILSEENFTPPTPAMDSDYIVYDKDNKIDVLLSYRNYYNHAKSHLFFWKNRCVPYWIKVI